MTNVDGQLSFGGSILVTVLGTLTRSSESRSFVQTFVLAPQEPAGFFVLNYVFRSFREAAHHDNEGKHEGKRSKKGKKAETPTAEHAPAPTATATAATAAAPAPAAVAAPSAAPVAAPVVATPAPVENKPAPVAEPKASAAAPVEHKAPAAAPAPHAAPATATYANMASKAPPPAATAPPKPAAVKAAPKARPAEAQKPAAAGNGTKKTAGSDFPSALCVKNIPFSTTEEQLLAQLSHFGKVKTIAMKKGFAFLDFESEEAVQKLLDANPVRSIFSRIRA